MNVISTYTRLLIGLFICFSCGQQRQTNEDAQGYPPGSFGYDVDFLSNHENTIVLTSRDQKSQVLLCGAYQGRVMTSTADGMEGKSYGWLNYELISSGETGEHINAYGGEDRFWLGPEGGQFSIFFKPGTSFVYEDWKTPAPIDTEPFDLVSAGESTALFTRTFSLVNYSGFQFDLRIDREITLADRSAVTALLGIALPKDIGLVAFESRNIMTNVGDQAWDRESGALSIWILGMFNPSPNTTIVIPYRQGDASALGPIVNDSYFGKVPPERLLIREGIIYFSADGQYRSKIGLSPRRAMSVAGSYDADNQVLTIVHIDAPQQDWEYVNSMWELQENPFRGDVINSYNDGPVDGAAMGPFYELESSSPAAFLNPGSSMKQVHRTIHFTGPRESLDQISLSVLGVPLDEIETVFQ